MADAGGGAAAAFNGKLSCAHENGTKVKNDTEVLFIKSVPDEESSILISVAKDLYIASDFTNNPNKSAKKFAQEAVSRAKAFCNVLKSEKLI